MMIDQNSIGRIIEIIGALCGCSRNGCTIYGSIWITIGHAGVLLNIPKLTGSRPYLEPTSSNAVMAVIHLKRISDHSFVMVYIDSWVNM